MGSCVRNRKGVAHETQEFRPRRPSMHHSNMKCIRKVDSGTGEVKYQRVHNEKAERLVGSGNWTYVSKQEYKKSR